MLQTQFPPVGATGLSGRVEWKSGQLRISSLNGVMGQSTLQGELGLDLTAAQPRVTGDLTLPVLDLRPFLIGRPEPAKPSKPTDIARSAAEAEKTIAELEKQSYSLTELRLLDADLTVQVGKWIGVPGDVRDAHLRLVVQDGRLECAGESYRRRRAPASAT